MTRQGGFGSVESGHGSAVSVRCGTTRPGTSSCRMAWQSRLGASSLGLSCHSPSGQGSPGTSGLGVSRFGSVCPVMTRPGSRGLSRFVAVGFGAVRQASAWQSWCVPVRLGVSRRRKDRLGMAGGGSL